MSRSLLKVFEHWFSKNPHHSNNLWTVLIFGGMVFLLLFTLTSFALASAGDQFDEDGFPFLEIAGFHAISGFSYFSLLTIGFELGVLFTILRLEFLTSHIGEKRPSSATRGLQLVELAYLLQTAPHACVVPSFCSCCPKSLDTVLFLSSYEAAPPALVPRNVSNLLKEVSNYVGVC